MAKHIKQHTERGPIANAAARRRTKGPEPANIQKLHMHTTQTKTVTIFYTKTQIMVGYSTIELKTNLTAKLINELKVRDTSPATGCRLGARRIHRAVSRSGNRTLLGTRKAEITGGGSDPKNLLLEEGKIGLQRTK